LRADFNYIRIGWDFQLKLWRMAWIEAGALNAICVDGQSPSQKRFLPPSQLLPVMSQAEVIGLVQFWRMKPIPACSSAGRKEKLRHGEPLLWRRQAEPARQSGETRRVQNRMRPIRLYWVFFVRIVPGKSKRRDLSHR
jgi:hypothetical protein